MNRTLKRTLVVLALLLAALILVAGGYVLFLLASYYRIPDATPLEVVQNRQGVLQTGKSYTALTYNIGFGAYGPDYSFFMDTGLMEDGSPVAGQHARALSSEAVLANIEGAAGLLAAAGADFTLLQEVDVEATRSYGVNQVKAVEESLPGASSVYASNFHTAYLPYPFYEPIGKTEAGLLTLSRYEVAEATRRSYPIDEGAIGKFFDLDRCFAVLRIPVAGGGQLVLINSHMSAYDEGGVYRAAQMEMLCEVLREERAAGNWVVVGGDFNHAFGGAESPFPTRQQTPAWVYPFPEEELPEGFSLVKAQNINTVPTCRSSDMPYTPGVNYCAVLDGFIVSDNVAAQAENQDSAFAYSDHNPVLLHFTLE